MYEAEVKLSYCRSGDVIANDIVNKDSIVLAGKNTILNDFIISTLKRSGIQKIWLYKEVNKEDCNDSHDNLNEKIHCKETAADIRTILHNLASGKCTKHEIISHIIKPIYKVIANQDAIVSYLHEIRRFDEYTFTHSINVAFYAMLIGEWLHFPEDKIHDLVLAGLLHDIGKLKIEKSILNKKEKLTDSEIMLIRQHCSIGYEMLRSKNIVGTNIEEAILFHHERMNGSGYPSAATGETISEFAKIVAIADVYDAMTSDRVYKNKVTPFEAIRMFTTEGAELFDYSMVKVFLLNITSFLVGTTVLLDNDMTGEVVYIPPQEMDKPFVQVVSPQDNVFIDSQSRIVRILCDHNFDVGQEMN